VALDPSRVPANLRSLLPLAERWGIGDDYERDAHVEEATPEERHALVEAVAAAPPNLWTWLFEQSQPPYTDEWAALTSLTQAADYARVNPR